MRGKQVTDCNSKIYFGITPADAGKTRPCSWQHHNTQDHPRGCGENQLHVHAITDDVGSPPQVRGKRS